VNKRSAEIYTSGIPSSACYTAIADNAVRSAPSQQ